MKRKKSNEQFSETFSRDSEKIYPFCISLVSSSLKDLENKWNNKNNNISKSSQNVIKILFSLLNYQIILIQQISKYYNLYLCNSDEDNIKFIDQIISINNELMNKKIEEIININLKTVQTNNCNNKISNEQTNRDYIYKKNRNKVFRNISCNEKKRKILKINAQIKKVEKKNNDIISNFSNLMMAKNINKLNLNDIVINTHTTRRKQMLKRTNTEKTEILNKSPSQKENNIESPKNERIKINLAEKFTKNNDNNEYTTLSNISNQSKKTFHTNLCLTHSTFNFHKKNNTYTLPVEENPVRKVKNIILNAKNSNLLFLKLENSISNTNLLPKERCSSYSTNRDILISEEINKDSIQDSNNLIEKDSNKLIFNKSTNSFNNSRNNKNFEIKKSMTNKNITVKIINNDNNLEIKVNNKERKCNQILKDGMKKIEKRLNSKDSKRELYKTKSNECISLMKKMVNTFNNNNKKRK